MKITAAIVAAFLLAAPASGALAQDYSTEHFDVGELTGQEGCFLSSAWTPAGRSEIRFEIDLLTTQELYAGVYSWGWSRPAEDSNMVLGVVFWSSTGERQIFAMLAAPSGSAIGEKPGLLVAVPEDRRDAFLSAFASSRSFTALTRDDDAAEDVKFDTVLEGGLTGSSLALTRMHSCVANVKRREDARRAREAAVAHIDNDPFK